MMKFRKLMAGAAAAAFVMAPISASATGVGASALSVQQSPAVDDDAGVGGLNPAAVVGVTFFLTVFVLLIFVNDDGDEGSVSA